eukprot:TRINITY_DN30316_c0_g1_i1.p1 TRINITY_DN30316_c0_g1~~TRINITY_DN30316_c0_g1_i1.p1  ORF type:complete len:233 (+),score=38.43 TRINITY_DN30316_c0_g1_i1:35-700(+)
MTALLHFCVLSLLPFACIGDILPPAPSCNSVCRNECSGRPDSHCCPSCGTGSCPSGTRELPNFRCEGVDLEPMSCCVPPECKADADCTGSQRCASGFCRALSCQELGGFCRSPSDDADGGACLAGEEVKLFEDRCASGCGYWRGRCGQTCCLPATRDRLEVMPALATPVEAEEVPPVVGSGDSSWTLQLTEVACLIGVAGLAVGLMRGVNRVQQTEMAVAE